MEKIKPGDYVSVPAKMGTITNIHNHGEVVYVTEDEKFCRVRIMHGKRPFLLNFSTKDVKKL